MKCAIPGRYGKPLRPQYHTTSNSPFSDLWKEIYSKRIEEYCKENYSKSQDDFDVQKEWEAHNEAIKEYSLRLGRGSGKTKLQNEIFEDYLKALKEKDAQEYSQK